MQNLIHEGKIKSGNEKDFRDMINILLYPVHQLKT
jgi:hypothetical protein